MNRPPPPEQSAGTVSIDRDQIMRDPGFGKYFTDHMVTGNWTAAAGWSAPEVVPRSDLVLSPAATVLHYGQSVFEGLKAFRHPDGSSHLFRPLLNAERFRRSAARLARPDVPPEMFLDSVMELVRVDLDWTPAQGSGAALYVRPILFGNDPQLGVRPAQRVEFVVVASPVGRYFAGSDSGISLWLTTEYGRAAPGGTGAVKCAGNYAGSLLPQLRAAELGCDQVLYTVAHDGEPHIDEAGTMNIFVVTTDDRLLTPPTGTALEGVTRDSVLRLAAEHGLEASQSPMSVAWFLQACRGGAITEVFATGTACAAAGVVGLVHDGKPIQVGDGLPGPRTSALRDRLEGIQGGTLPDTHRWLTPVTSSSDGVAAAQRSGLLGARSRSID